MLRLAIYGLPGVGKSTTCAALTAVAEARGRTATLLSLSEPLYGLQAHVYTMARARITAGHRDRVLMHALADQVRRLNPTALVDDVLARVGRARTDIIVNDEVHDPEIDYPRLATAGFHFLHVTCTEPVRVRRLAGNGDSARVLEPTAAWRLDQIQPHWTFDNTQDGPMYLHQQVQSLLEAYWA